MSATLRRRARLLLLFMLYAGTAVLAASTVLAELGERWWIADLFAHFRYHYALGAVLLAGAALMLGRRIAGLAAACLIVPQIWAVAAPPRTPEIAVAQAETRLRVMSINVLAPNRRYADVETAVASAAPDVVALQEVFPNWHPTVERLAQRLPHVAPADWRTRPSDNILLSRFPIASSRVVVIPGQMWDFAHVDAVLAIGDRRIRVLAVHPPYPMTRALTAMRQLHLDHYAQVAAAADLPLLIVGDFNITPYSPRFRTLLRGGNLTHVHLGWAWPATWPSEICCGYQRYVRGFPIDHILASRHFAVAAAAPGGYIGSDHYPVIADMVLRR